MLQWRRGLQRRIQLLARHVVGEFLLSGGHYGTNDGYCTPNGFQYCGAGHYCVTGYCCSSGCCTQ
jgi:hypothetical protein